MKSVFIGLSLIILSACSTSPNRTPQSDPSAPQDPWVQEMMRTKSPFQVIPTMALLSNNPDKPNEFGAPYAKQDCMHDPEIFCSIGYSFNMNKRTNCSPVRVAQSLMLINGDDDIPAFVDEQGHLVGLSCFKKSNPQSPLKISPETLYRCGIFRKLETSTSQDGQVVFPQSIQQ